MKPLLACTMLAASLLAAPAAHAAWPTEKPVQIVVGFSPGGGTDVMARLIARFAEEKLPGSRFVVVNKPGAGGTIAFSEVARAAPDGYTIGMINLPGYYFLPMYTNTHYRPDDLHVLARVVADPVVIFGKRGSKAPEQLPDLVARLKESPEALTFGHSGDGTVGHVGLLQMEAAAGFTGVSVPFKGGSEARSALLGEHIDYALLTTGEVMEAVQPDSAYTAVAQLAPERTSHFGNVPTARELGVDVVILSERGFAAPKGISPEIAGRLEALIQEILKDPAFLAAATADAPVLAFKSGAEWAAQIEQDSEAIKPLAAQMRK